MNFEETIRTAGTALGVKFTVENGACAFSAGEDDTSGVTILMQEVADHNVMLTAADLGELPPQGREELYRAMLEANNIFTGTGGATLSLDSADHVLLQRFDHLETFARQGAGRMIAGFVETALSWRRIIRDFRPGAAREASPESPISPFDPRFIRV